MMPEPPLLLHIFPSFAVGGAQTRFVAIANRFGAEFRHAIIAMDGNHTFADRLNPDLDVIYPTASFHKGDSLEVLRLCRRILRELRPDMLITSNWGSIEWAMANTLLRTRHLHMEDGFGPDESDIQLRRRVWTRRLTLRRSTILLPSRNLLRIATDIWRLSPKRLRYLPNGIDLIGSNGSDLGRDLWPKDDILTIGTVAVLRAEKNLPRLLRAFAKVTIPSRLVVVGDGPVRGELETLARQLGINDKVCFVGYVPEPQRLYACFDIFALSSDTEQMPLSVLEAMAAGKPVLSTDVGDVRCMLASENERFVVPCDDGALTDGLCTLLRDGLLRKALGAANRAKAQSDYDQEKMFNAHRDLWLHGI